MRSHVVKLPHLFPHQVEVREADARYKVCACGRRWGKTTLCLDLATEGHGPLTPEGRTYRGALDGARIWWVAPTYAQSTGVWASLKRALAPASARDRNDNDMVLHKSEVERTIWVPHVSGFPGSISVKTADDPDNLRGFGLDGVVLDESAFMKEETWNQVLRPALLDRGGWAMFISTPNGENWFFDLFERAVDRPGWARWQQPTWVNPIISDAEMDEMRNDPRISRLEFMQEIEAQFVSAGAGMFMAEWFRYYRRVDETYDIFYVLGERKFPTNHCRVFCTVDLAVTTKTTSHFTVCSTWAVTPESDLLLLDMVRERMEGPYILPMLKRVYEKWHPTDIAIEKVGFQTSLIQQARIEGLPVTELLPVTDKVTRALTAVAYMEGGKVWFPAATDWTKEFEHELVVFPEGEFDDMVDTLSYAAERMARFQVETIGEPVIVPAAKSWPKP